MNSFTYQYPVKNYFGEGALHTALAAELPAMGEKVMLAYGGGSIKRTGLYDEIVAALQDAGKTIVEFPGIMPNPTYEKVQEGARIAREEGVDFILAVGGGSVFDCCKIVSAQALLDEDIDDFEHVQDKTPTAFIPLGCVVTLSGTGAEQNNGGVITNEATKVKGRGCGRFSYLPTPPSPRCGGTRRGSATPASASHHIAAAVLGADDQPRLLMLGVVERAGMLYQREKHCLGGILGLGGASQIGVAQPVHRPNVEAVHSFHLGLRGHGFSFPFL